MYSPAFRHVGDATLSSNICVI